MSKFVSLPFLQTRIIELQDALFFNSGNSVLKIADQVIHAMYVDELGQVWFAVPTPMQAVDQFDKTFPARLDFFRKGKQFYIKVEGKAFIVDDPEELNDLQHLPEAVRRRALLREVVLLKLKIQFADYVETAVQPSNDWLVKAKTQLSEWFLQQPEDGYRSSSHENKQIALHTLIPIPRIFSN